MLHHLANDVAAAAVWFIGHDDVVFCNHFIRELRLRFDSRTVRQLDRAIRLDDRTIGNLDVLLASVREVRIRRVGTSDRRFAGFHLDVSVRLVRAVQCAVRLVRRYDDIVLIVWCCEDAILTRQLDRAIASAAAIVVFLVPLCKEFKRCCGERSAWVVLLLIHSHPVEEAVAVPLERVGDDGSLRVLERLDMHDAVGAVVDVVGQGHDIGIVSAAVWLDLDIAAVRLVDCIGTIRFQRAAVWQEDGFLVAIRLSNCNCTVVRDCNYAGFFIAADAVSCAGHIGSLVLRIAVRTGNGDGRAVLLVPLGVPCLRIVFLCRNGSHSKLEFAAAVCFLVPATKGPAGHDEGVRRAQCHREFCGIIGTHRILDLIRLSAAIVRQIGDRGGMCVGRLAPLCIESHISGDAGNFRIRTKILSADAVFRRTPAGKGLTAVGEGVGDGVDGLIVLINVNLIVTHAAVCLINHSDIAIRCFLWQLIPRLDLAAVRQFDRTVRRDYCATGNLDLFLAVRLVVGIGTGHSTCAVLRDLDAAVRLRTGDRSTVPRLDNHVVLVTRCGNLVIPTGQDDGTVRAAVMDHQCAAVCGRGDGDRIAVDILCLAIVQLIGFCLITVKGRNINAVFLILADLDGLFLCQRIAVVQILDRQVILILRRGGLRIVICDYLIGGPIGELDASVEAGGQHRCRAALYAGDANERVACLVRRGQGQFFGRRIAAAVRFIHLMGGVRLGCRAVCYSLDRNRDEVRLIVEGLFRCSSGFHRQEMGAILTGAQLVLAVQDVFRRGDGHLFAGHCLEGILVERHARSILGTGFVLDDNGAGGLGNIHKVDL